MQDFEVLSSVKRVVSRSRSVFFHPDRIDPAISEWGSRLDAPPSWEHLCHFFDGGEETVRWIFTVDLLNHCFWPDPGEPVWTVFYRDVPCSGYWGLAASIKRALETGFPVTDPLYLSRIGAKDLEEIFAGQGRIPMFEDRLRNLREAGSIILGELGGDVLTLFRSASGSAVDLVRAVASFFPCFRDDVLYHGSRVYFWKRAQIFAWDVFAAFGGKNWGEFHDIGRLTAFADYKLPQVLREMGVISYSGELAARIDAGEYLPAGSEEEVEIRAMTVSAVEELKRGFERSGRELTSTRVDNWLWQLGQLDAFRKHPYHKCRTIYY